MNRYLNLSVREITFLIFKSIGVMFLLNYTFYKSYIAFIPLFILGYLYFMKERNQIINKKKNEICIEFKEFLLLSVTNLRAGYSVENAMTGTYQELQHLYGKKAVICKMLDELKINKDNKKPLEDVFIRIGKLTDIEDIKDFGNIYSLAYKGAGMINSVMEQTSQIIMDKLNMREEMYTLLGERIFEMKIMCIMPFMIAGYIGLTNPGYFDVLYHNLKGIILMSVCLTVYVLAYGWSYKLLQVKI